jgi:voltage-gated potassium channel
VASKSGTSAAEGPGEPPRMTRTARRMLTKPLSAGRAARMIAEFTFIATVLGGTFAWLIDRQDFPTLGHGLWWAIQTVTTVGYGDITPHHTEGRVIATIVMLAGIAFVAVITASITATFVENARERLRGREQIDIAQELHEINVRLQRLEARQAEAGDDEAR